METALLLAAHHLADSLRPKKAFKPTELLLRGCGRLLGRGGRRRRPNWSSGSQSYSNNTTLTKAVAIEVNTPVAANSTNLEIDIAFTFADMSGLFLISDQALTIKTNSSSV